MGNDFFKANRFLAALIDAFFMFLILIFVCFAPGLTFFSEILEGKHIASSIFWFVFSIFGSFAIWILYLFLPSLFGSKATLGMKIARLSFVSLKDETVSISSVLFRETAVVICLVFSFGLSILSDSISIACNKEGKSFYDILFSIKVALNND